VARTHKQLGHISDDEPLTSPCPDWVLQRNIKVVFLGTLAKLKVSPSIDTGVSGFWIRLQTEEISKELEVGIDSEEGFA
jgi:hypothetical protein